MAAFPEERMNSAGQVVNSGKISKGESVYKEAMITELPYEFADPCPESMRNVNIADLSSVNINWKMLTLARPNNKTDEEIFSK